MTRTWMTRLLLLAPLMAPASTGLAQTPAPDAKPAMPAEPKPAAPAAADAAPAPAPAKPATMPKPAVSPKAIVHSTGGASGTAPHLPPRPAMIAKPAAHGAGGASGASASRPAGAAPAPRPPVSHPMGGASGTALHPAAGHAMGGTSGTAAHPAAKAKLPPPTGIRPAGSPALPGPVGPAPSMKPAAPHPAVTAGAPRPPSVPGATTPAIPHAVAAPAAPGPKPAPELDQLKFLRGRWRCDGKQFATPMFGPEHVFTATAEGKPMVDGFWDQYTYEERKSPTHHGLKVQGQWGWDQGAKHFTRVAVTNAGDWDSGTAPGFEGDKLVWTGEFSGPLGRMAYRHTLTKKSDKEWSHALELKDPSGKFAPINEVTCKR
ncbi:MAG TPA: hypothetical protein VHU40_14950 [Polyangia bacterium]|nr:hypothetical protein [Polyangia bacterium]